MILDDKNNKDRLRMIESQKKANNLNLNLSKIKASEHRNQHVEQLLIEQIALSQVSATFIKLREAEILEKRLKQHSMLSALNEQMDLKNQ